MIPHPTYGRCIHCGIVTHVVRDNAWNCGAHNARFKRIEQPWTDEQRLENVQRIREIYARK